MDQNYEINDTEEILEIKPEENTQTILAQASEISAAAASNDLTPITPEQIDPKQYIDAPFSYNYHNNESVSLNSGSLSYSVTDFSIPGKNGMDLVITRQYDSTNANIHDANVEYGKRKVAGYYYQYELWNKSSYYNEDYCVSVVKEGYYADKYECQDALDKERSWYPMYSWDSQGRKWTEYIKRPIVSYDPIEIHNTGVRLNNHFNSLYGLGNGWSFNFPSIEAVPDYDKNKNVIYYDYLHIGDGRSYRIAKTPTSTTASNLLDADEKTIPLTDVRIWQNTSTKEYILYFKDGKQALFGANKLLTRIQNRFGNILSFAFNGSGRLTSVTDTLNHTFDLVQENFSGGYSLKWKRRDSGEIEYTYIVDAYSSGWKLRESSDKKQHSTVYTYSAGAAAIRLFPAIWEPDLTNITYLNLTKISHPTGAQSIFSYQKYTDARDEEAQTQGFVIKSRENNYGLSDLSSRNKETYTFTRSSYEKGSGKNKTKRFYFSKVIVEKANNVTETHTFNTDSLRTSEIIKSGGITVTNKTFSYTNKLLTQESATIPYAKTEKFSYDGKANLLRHTDAMGYETTMTYDTTYSMLLTKSYKRDANATIIEANTISGGKITETRIFENDVLKQATGFLYDSRNRLIEEQHYFSLSGNTLQSSASDRVITYAYENDNSVLPYSKSASGMKDANGSALADITEYSKYDIYGRVTEKTDANGNITKIDYDAIGRLAKELYADGTSKQNSYDDTNNRIISTDENGNSKRFDYTPLGQISKVHDLKTNTLLAEYQYDNLCRLQKEITYGVSGIKSVAHYDYDHWNRPKSKKISTTIETPAASTQLLYEENMLYNDAFQSAYSKETKTVIGETSAPSIVAVIVKDKLGRVTEESVGSAKTFYKYDFIGNKLEALTSYDQSKGLLYSLKWDYDWAGRIIKEYTGKKDGESNRFTQTEFDALGNKIILKDYKGNAAIYSYDALGRLLEQKSPFAGSNKAITQFTYDAVGNILTQKILCSKPGAPEQWRKTEYSYDSRSRLIDTILYEENGTENRTQYEYDGVGNKTAMYTGITSDYVVGAAKTSYTYDQFGNMLTMTDPRSNALSDSDSDKRMEKYEYDRVGQLIRKTDRNKNTTDYAHDALGRLTAQTVTVTTSHSAVTSKLEYSYTKTGQKAAEIRTENQSILTTTYVYDDMGRLVAQTDPGGIKKDYEYDSNGNRIHFTLYKDNQKTMELFYEYDSLNRLSVVRKDSINGLEIARYTYDFNGNRDTLTHQQSGIQTSYSYNDANLVTLLTNKKDSYTTSSFSYAYQLDGNQIIKKDHTGKETVYTYDMPGRLIAEDEQGGNRVEYTFDANGNRAYMSVTAQNPKEGYAVTYEYDENNRLLKETKTSGNVETTTYYRYDANGNQIQKRTETLAPAEESKTPAVKFAKDLDGIEIMEYNGYNQLVFALSNGKKVDYVYRPDGLYAKTTTTGVMGSTGSEVSKSYIWDGQNIVAEANAHGVFARYYRGINLIARQIDANMEYYHFNAHGDVVQRTDNQGGVLKSYDYDAFGVEKNPEPMDANPWRYCGEYFERNTGTYYLRNRHYNPAVGRFTSEDTVFGVGQKLPNGQEVIDPLSLNLYTYCHNNPLMWVDKTGNWPTWGQIGMAVAIAAVTVLFVVAVVASAGAVGVVAAGVAGSLGASGAVMAGVSTVAVAGTYAVTGGIAITGANRAAEAVTGENYLAETVFQGNYDAYNNTELALNMAGYGAVSIGATVPSPPKTSASRYTGQYNPSANFNRGKLLSSHFGDHKGDFNFANAEQYAAGAENFLLKDPTKTTLSFTSDMGWYFRYDTKTQEFGIMNQYGGISTYYKTDYSYWLDQMKRYGPK